MSSILVINAAGRETRVALVENGDIAEFYLERKKDKGIVGNIYKGRVVRVLPGMQAAFLDVGLDKAAFLYVSDVVYDPDFARSQFDLTEGEHDEEVPDVPEGVDLAADSGEPGAEPAGEHGPDAQPDADPDAGSDVAADAGAEGGAPVDERPAPAPLVEASSPAPEAAASGPGPVPIPAAQPATESVVTEAQASPAPAEEPGMRGEHHAPRDERGRTRGERDRSRGRLREEEKVRSRKPARIEELLKVGQEVVVQISKDPIGSKGARLTSHISIPGRHLVFMPTVDHVGISRRISNEKERRRLREIVDRLRPPGTGFIVRTVAENVPQAKLESDIRFLIEIWNQVVRRNERRNGPGLLHPDLDLILRATRDLFAQDVEQLVVDDRDEYQRILSFVTAQDAALASRVVLHDSEEPVFDAYGIEQELQRAAQRKVWLKSGGYLIFDQAEALTAIDVNSGRYVGKKSLEETITKINVEAAREIVYQLRLRNIGGIIICDFIDMEKAQNRDKVYKTLQESLGRDKAKTNVLRISELGLVEMTRKRVRESLGRVLHEDCGYCAGQGFVKTVTTVVYDIFREIRREAPNVRDPTLVVNCNSEVARVLQGEEREELRHLMDRFNKAIQVRAQGGYHREQFDLYARTASGEDHRVATSKSALRYQEGLGSPVERHEPPPREGGGGGGGGGRGRRRDRRRDRREGGSSGSRGSPPPKPPAGPPPNS
ncbi:MAG TPA: Rne/Rng family ribonuclease [Myxococcaceae bacterium]|nr:Rne/Rng family ribonuclease [Myxococcaceae bacterium]